MYEAFFNLKNKPFSLLPDPEFLFLSSRHAIGLSLLDYSLTGQAGFCVITGEIGSGKTTLVRAFLGRVGREFTVGLISNTHASLKDISSWALAAFGQKPVGSHPAETYQELMSFLIAEYGSGRQCILIVDEAQNLSIEVLEELRLLSNINSGKDLLLQVVLVGQPELLEKLKRPELQQFAQRIAISHHLSPLPYSETRRYIEHRVKVAGSDRPLFTEMAMGAVQYFSGGIPRLINSICDMALVYGFADEKQVIGEDLVFRVVSDRQLSGIAPFAQHVPADDPAVRDEIMKLANITHAPAEDAPAGVPEQKKTEPVNIPSAETVFVSPARAEIPEADLPEANLLEANFAPAHVEAPTASLGMAPLATSNETMVIAPAPTVILREPAPAPAIAEAAPLQVPADSPNPYFFRQPEDDELLLTPEMSDSTVEAHRPATILSAAFTATGSESYSVTPMMDAVSQTAMPNPNPLNPNPGLVAEDLRAQIVDGTAAIAAPKIVETMPWPSVNERRPATPIPTKEQGTGALPRRSWWRRSIGRNS